MSSCKFRSNSLNKVILKKPFWQECLRLCETRHWCLCVPEAVPSLMVAVHTVCPESASVKDSLKGGLSSKKTSKYPFTSTMTGVKSMSCTHTHTGSPQSLRCGVCWDHRLTLTLTLTLNPYPNPNPYLGCDVAHGLADQTVLSVLLQHARGWLVYMNIPLVVLTVVGPPDGSPDVLQQ